jgi:peptidoglycan/xylan/chitin deacetylase (PgdA/CDA1 family)
MRPISLMTLLHGLAQETIIENSVVVTFDDGYSDNLSEALPILEQYGVPATFFLPSSALESAIGFWWDALDALLLQPGVLPRELRLTVDGHPFEWSLGDASRYSSDEAVQCRGWRAWVGEPPTGRHLLYKTLWEICQKLGVEGQASLLDQLHRWARVESRSKSTLSADDARHLAESALVEIGAHTIHHPRLASLPASHQRHEIEGGKTDLESLLRRPVTTFAYPFGRPGDYTSETVNAVREAGFVGACSNVPGLVTETSDPFQLPRLFVQDWDGDTFADCLMTYTG